MNPTDVVRCAWAGSGLMAEYHDREWGRPVHDERALFEFLVLEGAQAGLSWSTILNKRLSYRHEMRALDRPCVPDCCVLLGVFGLLPEQDALVGQPVVQCSKRTKRRHALPQPVPNKMLVHAQISTMPRNTMMARAGHGAKPPQGHLP